jgi:hypothetical protein
VEAGCARALAVYNKATPGRWCADGLSGGATAGGLVWADGDIDADHGFGLGGMARSRPPRFRPLPLPALAACLPASGPFA